MALTAADRAYLVVPAEPRACAIAQPVAARVAAHCPALRVVVRGRAPAGLRARDVAGWVGYPLAGVIRTEPGLAKALARGEPPVANGRGPLADLCRQIVAEFAPRRHRARR